MFLPRGEKELTQQQSPAKLAEWFRKVYDCLHTIGAASAAVGEAVPVSIICCFVG